MRLLLRLYPRAWRERYQSEMEAVLEDVPFSVRGALDLALAAADAHLHPQGGLRPSRLPLILQLALVAVVVACLVPSLPAALYSVSFPLGLAAYDFLPVVVPLLAALASRWAGWSAASWFCALLAIQVTLQDNRAWVLISDVHPTTSEPAIVATAALLLAATAVAGALLLHRRAGWVIGLGVGAALFLTVDLFVLRAYLGPELRVWTTHPAWFRLSWLVDVAQAVAWGALTAALLRRSGATWRAGLVTGCLLWLLIGARAGSPLPRLLDGVSAAYQAADLGPALPIQLWMSPLFVRLIAWAGVMALLFGRGAPAPAQLMSSGPLRPSRSAQPRAE
jgi:hypothetical protein